MGVRTLTGRLGPGFFRVLLTFRPRRPAQVLIGAFGLAVTLWTAVLMLPVASADGSGADFRTALFTATSAVCVTGLTVVDTGAYWSGFGTVAILLAIQTGGFGIMTFASLLGLLVSRRLGLTTRLLAQAETRSLQLGDVSRVVRGVAVTSLTIEFVVAMVLFVRLWVGYGYSPTRAAWNAIFHGVSAFNNAGFALFGDGLERFVTDPFITLPVAFAVILGGLGFPVLFELRRELRRPIAWSLHTKITLLTSGILLAGGTVFITVAEWSNPGTLGPLSVPGKVLAGFFQGVMPRSGGLHVVPVSEMREHTWLATDVLMFIGGGSASTAGGIKVTTFMVLFFAIVAEARGEATVDTFGRRLSVSVLRQALAIALLAVAVVTTATLAMLAMTGLDLDRVLFEVTSAFSVCGLSTGITADLPAAGQYLLIVLMFFGRTGTVTLASALALRERPKLYRLPEGRPIVG